MRKRLIALGLVIGMLLPSGVVWADDEGILIEEEIGRQEEVSDDGVTCVLDGNGTLTISGKGEIWNISNKMSSLTEFEEIRHVVIGEGITGIGTRCFEYCGNLESVQMLGEITEIGSNAFRYCEKLQEIQIPDSVREIGAYAFANCDSLKELRIPEGVCEIKDGVCMQSVKLQSVSLPDSVKEIGDNAFSGCIGLSDIRLPVKLDRLGHGAFYRCSSLEEITIPEGLKEIRGITFEECSSLRRIEIPDGVEVISNQVFEGCSSLTQVSLPESLKTISRAAFKGCDSIEEVSYAGSNRQWKWVKIYNDNYNLTRLDVQYASIKADYEVPGDEWNFQNYDVQRIPLKEAERRGLRSQFMTEPEKEYMDSLVERYAEGQCYGMAVTSALAAQGKLSLKSIKPGLTSLYEAPRDGDSEAVIGYYHLMQYFTAAQGEIERFRNKSIETKLSEIESMTKPFVLVFAGDDYAHAVTGYGIEKGLWSSNGTEYKTRALIYDCVVPYEEEQNELAYLYFNSDTGEWEIPLYVETKGVTSKTGISDIIMACDDPELFAEVSLTMSRFRGYMIIGSEAIKNKITVMKDSVKTRFDSFKAQDIKNFIHIFRPIQGSVNDSQEETFRCITIDEMDACQLAPSKAGEPLSVSLLIGEVFFEAEADSYQTAEFKNDKEFEAEGIRGAYAIRVTADNDLMDFSTLKISGGNPGYIDAKVTEQGVVIDSENLKGVTITAEKTDENTLECVEIERFELTDAKESVLIGVGETGEIAAYEDADGDGSFEKEIAKVSEEKKKTIEFAASGYTLTKKWEKLVPEITYLPEGTKKSDIKWVSEDDKIARVTSSGTVMAVNGGETVITAYVSDEIRGSFTVTVEGVKPDTPMISKVQSLNYEALKLTWNRVYQADGYRIYRANSLNGTYRYVTQIRNGDTISYTDKGRISGRSYYYKVRAYRRYMNEKGQTKAVFGNSSTAKRGRSIPAAPKMRGVSKNRTITWSQVAGAGGYQLYYKSSAKGKWKCIADLRSGKKTSYTHKVKGKTYFYRVRAYRIVNRKQIYGAYSKTLSRTK